MSTTAESSKTKSKKTKTKSSKYVDERDGEESEVEESPLKNFAPVSAVVEEVDWDSIKQNPNIELWAVRVPLGLKVKQLDGLQIPISSTSSSPSSSIHTLSTESASYDIYPVPSTNEGNDDADIIGGQEMPSLTCLLPRSSKRGRMYTGPKISRNFVISQSLTPPTPTDPTVRLTASNKHVQPTHLLKHRFLPIGARAKDLLNEGEERAPEPEPASMDVDPSPVQVQQEDKVEESEPKPKKRKKEKHAEDGTLSKKEKKEKKEKKSKS